MDREYRRTSKQVKQLAKAFRIETINKINELGFKGYVEFAIKEAKRAYYVFKIQLPRILKRLEKIILQIRAKSKRHYRLLRGSFKRWKTTRIEMAEYKNRLLKIEIGRV